MRPLARRLARLEAASGFDVTRPREVMRLIVRQFDITDGRKVQRTLCQDGTLIEVVRIGYDDFLNGDEMNRWVEMFPGVFL